MQTRIKRAVALLVVLAAGIAISALWPSGEKPGGPDSASGSGDQTRGQSPPGAAATGGGGHQPIIHQGVNKPSGPGSGRLAETRGDDDGQAIGPDTGEPRSPPDTEKLAADALVRQRDMVKTQLESLRERIPKLKAVLDRVRGNSDVSPTAIEQIQTQLQQSVDAVTRLERLLPDLEAEVARLPGPASEKSQPTKPQPP